MVLHLLLMYGIAVQGLQAFKWTSPIPDGDVIYACQGATVSLPWHIQTGPDDVISVIQWFYSGHSEEVVAVFTHGAFVTFPAFADRVTHVDDASITLGPVIPADSGNYTVQVTGSSVAGHHYELRQTVYVQISDHLMTQDGYLHIHQRAEPVLDTTTGQWTVQLMCGQFTFHGQPPFSVQWTTPDGIVKNSSSYDGGYFHLSLTGALHGGTYVCRVPRQDLNTSCLFGDGDGDGDAEAVDAEASIVLDAVYVRLVLLEREHLQTEQRLKKITARLNELTGSIQVLHHIPTRIRLVGGRNAREGRVEIVVGGNWGTVCDDDWDSRDAQVVCNMLGYTAPGAAAKVSAAFGEGGGAIVMDDVNCHGNETDIKLCQTRDLGTHNCGHGEDAGVICVG